MDPEPAHTAQTRTADSRIFKVVSEMKLESLRGTFKFVVLRLLKDLQQKTKAQELEEDLSNAPAAAL
jgi:hypothetical protein